MYEVLEEVSILEYIGRRDLCIIDPNSACIHVNIGILNRGVDAYQS